MNKIILGIQERIFKFVITLLLIPLLLVVLILCALLIPLLPIIALIYPDAIKLKK